MLGPTNSGKTHDAFERLVAASSGVYLGPLRLLALEAFTRLNEEFDLWVSRHDPGAEVMTTEHHEFGLQHFAPIYERLGIAAPPIEPPDDFSFEQQVEVILDLRTKVFSFVFGIPAAEIMRECTQRGILTAGAGTTLEEAESLDQAGVDMIVATGSDAGGHRPSFLRSAEDSLTGTLSLVPQVRKVTRRPVIAAGGIAEAHGVRAAFQLGADAVQIGTAFLACEESNCPPLHREALFTPAAARTRLSRRFTGRLARFMSSALCDVNCAWTRSRAAV